MIQVQAPPEIQGPVGSNVGTVQYTSSILPDHMEI